MTNDEFEFILNRFPVEWSTLHYNALMAFLLPCLYKNLLKKETIVTEAIEIKLTIAAKNVMIMIQCNLRNIA